MAPMGGSQSLKRPPPFRRRPPRRLGAPTNSEPRARGNRKKTTGLPKRQPRSSPSPRSELRKRYSPEGSLEACLKQSSPGGPPGALPGPRQGGLEAPVARWVSRFRTQCASDSAFPPVEAARDKIRHFARNF